MIQYCIGFAYYNTSSTKVILIEKQKPEWQKGLLNGVGGKIEDGETPLFAMQREFKEETDLTVNDWEEYCTLTFSDCILHVFRANITLLESLKIKQTTIEKPFEIFVNDLYKIPHVSNLSWLIPLALDNSIKQLPIQINC